MAEGGHPGWRNLSEIMLDPHGVDGIFAEAQDKGVFDSVPLDAMRAFMGGGEGLIAGDVVSPTSLPVTDMRDVMAAMRGGGGRGHD